MGVPVTLQEWRHHVARDDPQPPERLSRRQWQRLTTRARDAHDLARIAWLASDVVFTTRDIDELTTLARVSVMQNSVPSATARRGIAVSGSSTLGKSTAVLHLGRVHEQWQRARTATQAGIQPTVYVVVPAATTPKMLMQAIAGFLGLPVRVRDSTQAITDRNAAVLAELRTSMVIVDEVHNLRTSRSFGAEAASALKAFSERLDATLIYAGVNLPASTLFSGEVGAQIKGRMVVHEMRPFSRRTKTGRAEWLELVGLCEDMLVLYRHPLGTLRDQAEYLYERTGGSIGSLRALVADAAARVILDGTEAISRRVLESVPSDQQASEFTNALPASRQSGRARRVAP